MFYSPLLLSSEQQSVHAKEATKDMEVAILKTSQSVSDLRREVSSSLSVWLWKDVPGYRIGHDWNPSDLPVVPL